MASSIDLTISKDYVPTWGVIEGVRELFQNALDQQAMSPDNKMDWSYSNSTLTISNKHSMLTRDTLLFGVTTKVDNNSTIGQFGEGYKLAMLVLTRVGKTVTIYNNSLNEKWSPRFKTARKLNNATLLTVDISTLRMPWNNGTNDLDIVIEGITEDEFQELKETNLHLAEYSYEGDYSGEHGTVLVDESMAGKIFVSGLYVSTSSEIHYGYDFKPSCVKLNRDRNMIDGYDLKDATSRLCLSLPTELLEEAIQNDYADIKYVYYKLNSHTVKENIVSEVVKQHGTNIKAVTSQRDADTYSKIAPELKTIVVSDVVANIINNSDLIEIKEKPTEETEEERHIPITKALKGWILENKQYLADWMVDDLLQFIKNEEDYLGGNHE